MGTSSAAVAEVSDATNPAEAPSPTLLTCKVQNGALVESPIWENHARGKNWLAVIRADPLKPGGLGREWMPHARGDYFYVVRDLRVGDPIEFGADYVTGSGRKHAKRWYGFVREKTEEVVVFEHCETPTDAIEAAKPVRAAAAAIEAQQAREARERADAAHAQWLKEQDERRAREKAERERRKADRLAAAEPAAKRAKRIATLEKRRETLLASLAKVQQELEAERGAPVTTEVTDEAV